MFTMSEYIKKQGLACNPHDKVVTKMLAEHLGRLGYHRRRQRHNGVNQYVWVKKARDLELKALQEQLSMIEHQTMGEDSPSMLLKVQAG